MKRLRAAVIVAVLCFGAAAIALDLGLAQTVTVNLSCPKSNVFRDGNHVYIVCQGRPAPSGAAFMYCFGNNTQCGR